RVLHCCHHCCHVPPPHRLGRPPCHCSRHSCHHRQHSCDPACLHHHLCRAEPASRR
ncbi:hypothetical protein HK405_003781, partial [Cladochytrium tenue]